jgi:acetyl esterase/lipase
VRRVSAAVIVMVAGATPLMAQVPSPSADLEQHSIFYRRVLAGPPASLRALFDSLRTTEPSDPGLSEGAVNKLGYDLLARKRGDEAIAVFLLNAELHPASANTFDSLAEAYAAAGRRYSAIASYRTALSLFPNNEYEYGVLKQLQSSFSPEQWAELFRPMIPASVEFIPNVTYCRVGSRPLRLHLVRPTARGAAVPLLIFIHGGGWSEGTKERGIVPLVRFAQQGYAGATVEYRLSEEARFPAQIADVKCAIRYLRSHASEYGIDPNRIGLWGQSAGGHLAALAGTSGDDSLAGPVEWQGTSSRVRAVIDWNGPTDFIQDTAAVRTTDPEASAIVRLLGGPIPDRRALAALANPITYVSADDPPFLILHGNQDRTVPLGQSVLLRDALRRVGVPVELHLLEGEGHFGVDLVTVGHVSDGLPANEPFILATMDTFLAKYLKSARAPKPAP